MTKQELSKKHIYLLELLGFKQKFISTFDGRDITDLQYYQKTFKNGDLLSICLTDKSEGGNFGGKGWEKVEVEVDKIRHILKEEGLIE